jgi:dihydrolipoamide dehydrogenase
MEYDVVVIGAGPGGYVAAIKAAQLGLKVAVVEKDAQLGGTCLLRGCIPTKSLLHSADVYTALQGAKDHGITASDIGFDFSLVQKARAKVVQKSAAGVRYLMQQNKIDVRSGYGRIKSPTLVAAGDDVLRCKHILLATGSVPKPLPGIKIDGQRFLTSDEILTLAEPPKSLLILGAGAVGVEFASVYSRFGSKVTVVEMMPHALPIEDEDISIEFERALQKRGILVLTGTKLARAQAGGALVHADLETPQGARSVSADMCLVATGRAPVTDDIGLDAVGIVADARGYIPVNAWMQTKVPNIYAIGDIVATAQLAHIASAEALVAATHIATGTARPLNYRETPSCTYSDPEVASVGLTERAAKAQGHTIKVGKFPFAALGKARIMGQTEGFVKIIADARYDEILGVHILGPRATDLIAEACVAMRCEATAEELAHTIHAHPTLPEAILEAAHATSGRALHL